MESLVERHPAQTDTGFAKTPYRKPTIRVYRSLAEIAAAGIVLEPSEVLALAPCSPQRHADHCRESQHIPMTALTSIASALAELTDGELYALLVASNGVPKAAYALRVWIERACDWEFNRRAGRHYDLLPPEGAIGQSEGAASTDAAHSLRARLAASGSAPAVLRLFDVMVTVFAQFVRERGDLKAPRRSA
jgi:hypothetical protein